MPSLPSISDLLRGVAPSPEDYNSSISEYSLQPPLLQYAQSWEPKDQKFEPQSEGWFNADQEECRQALKMVRQRRLDENPDRLYNAAWEIDNARPLYKNDKERAHDGSRPGETPGEKHSLCEKNRRVRHAQWQETSHIMTPEIAHQAVEHDRLYLQGKSRKTGKKSPASAKAGKDEQLCSVLYTQAFLALALQSEHQARVQAEEALAAASQRLALAEGRFKRRHEEEDDSSSVRSPKRRLLSRPLYRLPPSPSLTATLSPSPTPTLSASASFSNPDDQCKYAPR